MKSFKSSGLKHPEDLTYQTIMSEISLYDNFITVIKMEADAIYRSVELIDKQEVDKALQLLINCKGKIIVTGVGKSGHIASKIAATLTSTGSPAIVLSAADALHGDIGIVSSNDVFIALSNSGETQELLALLPHIKLRKTPLLSIVGDTTSSLAQLSDAVINANIEKEACPLNLAPTTSTTLALAIGDALAMSLMTYKNIKSEDFAFNHPAGKLGKRLSLKVRDIMHPNISAVDPDTSWTDIIQTLTETKTGAVVITGANQRLLGIITDGDIRRFALNPLLTTAITAREIMTSHPLTTLPDTLAYEALKTMENRPTQISVLPVVDSEGVYLGLLRIHDILGKL